MLETKIEELNNTIKTLIDALNKGSVETSPASAPAAVNPTALVPGAPLSATPAQTAAVASPVPTAAPQYTLDMLATAGAALIDAGKMEQLMQLLNKHGVASLQGLHPDSYGVVAGELRALGATI